MKKHFATVLALMFVMGLSMDTQAAQIKDDQGKLQYVKVIDVEHHFESPILTKTFFSKPENIAVMSPEQVRQHELERDLDKIYLQELDKAGIDYAHVSLTTPGSESWDVEMSKKVAAEANDCLAVAIKKHPERIGGYISLAPDDVEWSLKEIDRCVAMGLWGWSTMSNYNGKSRLDDPKYLPLLKRCAELKMPIFIHPWMSNNKEIVEPGYPLWGPNFGFTADTQLTFLRMIYRGIFDKFPDLKIILGHNAEGLAIYADRVDTAHRQGMEAPYPEFGKIKHPTSYYLYHNLLGDTSGNFLPDVVHFTRHVFGDKFLVLGTDYPYEDTKASVDLIKNDFKLTFAQKKAILQTNAQAVGIGVSKKK